MKYHSYVLQSLDIIMVTGMGYGLELCKLQGTYYGCKNQRRRVG